LRILLRLFVVTIFAVVLGNKTFASYVVQAGEVKFCFTAPYNNKSETDLPATPHPNYDTPSAIKFIGGILLSILTFALSF
jgi:hypothetical protein